MIGFAIVFKIDDEIRKDTYSCCKDKKSCLAKTITRMDGLSRRMGSKCSTRSCLRKVIPFFLIINFLTNDKKNLLVLYGQKSCLANNMMPWTDRAKDEEAARSCHRNILLVWTIKSKRIAI